MLGENNIKIYIKRVKSKIDCLTKARGSFHCVIVLLTDSG